MTILLLGSTGQVGWELARALAPLAPIVQPGRAQADLSKPDSLRRLVREIRPRLIVNAAAYTAVDKAREEPSLALAVNGTAPGILAEEAFRQSIPLVHYSTDYVFDGRKAGTYVETDPTGPLNVYGHTKLEGERAVSTVGCSHLIFRTSWVYGLRGKNFLRTIRRLAKEQDRLAVVNDQMGAPTWCRMIAETTALALAQCRRPDGGFDIGQRNGTYHLAAGGVTSWHGFAEAILALDPLRDQYLAKRVDPISTERFNAPERRPANSQLSGARLQSVFGLSLPDWQLSLQQVMDEIRTA